MLTRHQDHAATLGERHGESPIFVSNARKATKDGSEDSREDQGPPVTEIFYHDVRDLEELRGQQHDQQSPSRRPFTSLDGPGESRGLSRRNTDHQLSHQLRRQHRSMENVAEDPALEISMARSRLRSIAAPKQPPAPEVPEPLRTRALTMDELNVMLDDAIKSNSPKPEVSSDEQPVNLAPKPGFVLRRASTRQDRERQRSQSRARMSRRTTTSIEPHSSEETTRVHYNEAELAQQRRAGDRGGTTGHLDNPKDSPAAPRLRPLPPSNTQLSPVKQRAAIFEVLSKNAEPSGHDSVCRHFGHEHDPTHDHVHHHGPRSHEKPKKVHRIKFGNRIEERPATPLIPLTLPTLVTREKTVRSPTPAPERKQETEEAVEEAVEAVAEEPTSDDVFKEATHERKSSLSWPFKWGLFNKGASAPPQESEATRVATKAKDEHYPVTRPSVARNKVQEILQAAEEKDDAEQRRRMAEKERMARRNTRAAPPSRRQTAVRHVDPEQEMPADPTPVETPKKEQPQGLNPAVAAGIDPRTPLQRAMSEKQVLAPPVRPEQGSDVAPSPQKSLPQTPVRGRPSHAHGPAPQQTHSVERQFNLSPARSASRQRQGVKVEVEIRDSPEREARERGGKIVIIRADVASDMDDEVR